MEYEKVDKGSFIIKKGDAWKKFYCILRGRVLVKFRNDILEANENFMFFNRENVNFDLNCTNEGKLENLKEMASAALDKNYNKSLSRFNKLGTNNPESLINKEDHKVKSYDNNLNERKLCK